MIAKLKVFKTFASTIFCLIAQIHFAGATTYYISNSGNDANNGTSISTPWQTLNTIFTNSESGHLFHAGDNILLQCGGAFAGPLSLENINTAGPNITIGSYGTGARPCVFCDHTNVTWTAYTAGITNTGIYTAYLGVHYRISIGCVYSSNGYTNILTTQGTNTLANWLNSFTSYNYGLDTTVNIYVKTPDGNPPAFPFHIMDLYSVSIPNGYIGTNMIGYITLTNLEICNGDYGIGLHGIGCVISNCLVHDQAQAAMYLQSCSYGNIVSNVCATNAGEGIYLVGGGSNWVHYNNTSYNTNKIFNGAVIPAVNDDSSIGLAGTTNDIIEFNELSYTQNAFFDFYFCQNDEIRYNYGFHATTGMSPTGTGLKIHHNIFDMDGGSGCVAAYQYGKYPPIVIGGGSELPIPTGNDFIYNNVFYNVGNLPCYGIDVTPTNSGALTGPIGVVFRNNIIVMSNSSGSLAGVATGVDMDYDLYYCTGGTANHGFYWSGSRTSFAAFQTASGLETHGYYANPQFVSPSPVTAADFQLKSISPCIDAAQNLILAGLLAPIAQYQDCLGTLIPQGTAPDIGAYEYTGSPGPPTDFRIIYK